LRLRLKCDDTRAETRFRLSAKRTNPFKSAGASVPSTTGSRGVRISGSNAGYTVFRCSVKSTGYPLHSPVSPSLPLPCVNVCHHVSTGLCHTVIQLGGKAVSWHGMKKIRFVYAVHSRYSIAYAHHVVSNENMITSIRSRLMHVVPCRL
jgi:hypothetical protein